MGKQSRLKGKPAEVKAELIKLDFGCGPHKREGFKGVDAFEFVGVDFVVNLKTRYPDAQHITEAGIEVLRGRFKPWPWADSSVEEANASHFIEHLDAEERTHFVNELYRILVPGGKCQIIVPHWASNRAYGDPTHKWPPVAEMWFYYLSKEWRLAQAPHTDIGVNPFGLNCDFECTWGYSLRPDLLLRNQQYQQDALADHKEAAQDTIATLTKKA